MNDKNQQKSIDSFSPDLNSKLLEMEEEHYLFLIADLKKATIIIFKNGEIEITRDIMDPSVNKKIKSNSGELSGRNTKLEHKIDNQIHRHLKLIVEEAKKILVGNHVNGIFIGGHKTMFSALEKELPQDLQKLVRGEFVTELNIERVDLIEHCRKTLSEYLKQ